MKGANMAKKFSNRMKSCTQVLGVQNIENDKEKVKKEIKKNFLQYRQYENEISTLNNTILTLKEEVQALTSLISKLIKDKCQDNIIQRNHTIKRCRNYH